MQSRCKACVRRERGRTAFFTHRRSACRRLDGCRSRSCLHPVCTRGVARRMCLQHREGGRPSSQKVKFEPAGGATRACWRLCAPAGIEARRIGERLTRCEQRDGQHRPQHPGTRLEHVGFLLLEAAAAIEGCTGCGAIASDDGGSGAQCGACATRKAWARCRPAGRGLAPFKRRPASACNGRCPAGLRLWTLPAACTSHRQDLPSLPMPECRPACKARRRPGPRRLPLPARADVLTSLTGLTAAPPACSGTLLPCRRRPQSVVAVHCVLEPRLVPLSLGGGLCRRLVLWLRLLRRDGRGLYGEERMATVRAGQASESVRGQREQ